MKLGRDLVGGVLSFVLISSFGACTRSGQREVNLAIWSDYLAADLLTDFEKSTGIKVKISNYSSNEELLAKLQAGASGYDVAVPSDYMVFAMAKLGLLTELDRAKLSQFKALDPKFLGRAYDSQNKYSVPYNWGMTGIAVNHALFKGQITGWKSLFNNPEAAGKFTLLDDVRETVGMALKAQGLSLNTRKPEDLKKAQDFLMKIRGKIKGYTSEPKMPLANGETAIAHSYVPDALQASRLAGGKIDFIIPEEGCTLWIDNLVIPAGAKHVAEAHEFINYLINAQSNASTVTHILVSPVNRETIALLPPELRANPALFPPAAKLAKCEMMEDLGDATAIWDRVWTEVKAQR